MTLPRQNKDKKPPSILPMRPLRIGPRITCPRCGNDRQFYEIAEEATLTTRYIQNPDGSFTLQSDDSQILGEIKFYCGECHADLSQYHRHFVEMLF